MGSEWTQWEKSVPSPIPSRTTCFMASNIFACWGRGKGWENTTAAWERQKDVNHVELCDILISLRHQSVTYAFVPSQPLRRRVWVGGSVVWWFGGSVGSCCFFCCSCCCQFAIVICCNFAVFFCQLAVSFLFSQFVWDFIARIANRNWTELHYWQLLLLLLLQHMPHTPQKNGVFIFRSLPFLSCRNFLWFFPHTRVTKHNTRQKGFFLFRLRHVSVCVSLFAEFCRFCLFVISFVLSLLSAIVNTLSSCLRLFWVQIALLLEQMRWKQCHHWEETKDRHRQRGWGLKLLFISLNFSLFQLISSHGTLPLYHSFHRIHCSCLIVCLPLTVWLMRLMQSGNYSLSWFSR